MRSRASNIELDAFPELPDDIREAFILTSSPVNTFIELIS